MALLPIDCAHRARVGRIAHARALAGKGSGGSGVTRPRAKTLRSDDRSRCDVRITSYRRTAGCACAALAEGVPGTSIPGKKRRVVRSFLSFLVMRIPPFLSYKLPTNELGRVCSCCFCRDNGGLHASSDCA